MWHVDLQGLQIQTVLQKMGNWRAQPCQRKTVTTISIWRKISAADFFEWDDSLFLVTTHHCFNRPIYPWTPCIRPGHLRAPLDPCKKVKGKVKVHTLDIAPLLSETPPQKRSGMARVLKGFHSFTCIPTRSSAIGMSHTCLCLPSRIVVGLLEREFLQDWWCLPDAEPTIG